MFDMFENCNVLQCTNYVLISLKSLQIAKLFVHIPILKLIDISTCPFDGGSFTFYQQIYTFVGDCFILKPVHLMVLFLY